MKKWKVRQSVHKFADGIEYGKQTILHLVEGSRFNEKNCQLVVALLNKNGKETVFKK